MPHRLLLTALFALALAPTADARKWTDATGKYSIDADLIARNEELAVLQRPDHKLVSVNVRELSKADQEYLESKKYEPADRAAEGMHDWTLPSGLKVRGRVVGYGRKEVVLLWRRGKIYVNDRQLENLPEIYQRMLPKIVGYFTKKEKEFDSPTKLRAWMEARAGKPQRFTVDGVQLELENGDVYGVPFFFFNEEDLRRLKAGWDRWLAAEQDSPDRERENLYVESQAAAMHRQPQESLAASEQAARNQAESQQISQLQLGLLATIAGVVDLWEVSLIPNQRNGWPQSVIVPARDSRAAVNTALARNPGYVAGPVRKVSNY